MSEPVYLALKDWAAVPTWYTFHPADEARFQAAVTELAETVGTDVDLQTIRRALRQHRDESPALLGGKPSDTQLDVLARKVLDALSAVRQTHADLARLGSTTAP